MIYYIFQHPELQKNFLTKWSVKIIHKIINFLIDRVNNKVAKQKKETRFYKIYVVRNILPKKKLKK